MSIRREQAERHTRGQRRCGGYLLLRFSFRLNRQFVLYFSEKVHFSLCVQVRGMAHQISDLESRMHSMDLTGREVSGHVVLCLRQARQTKGRPQ